jgi:hypothetical protein
VEYTACETAIDSPFDIGLVELRTLLRGWPFRLFAEAGR